MSVRAALLLLADSQLLFRPSAVPQAARHLAGRPLQAAYVGAANGNQVEFFELACAGLASLLGCEVPCRHIITADDVSGPLPSVVILAGGSVSAGWDFIHQPVVRHWLQRIGDNPNALVVGVSAGAIHLGRGCDPEQMNPRAQPYLDWLPCFVTVHEEQQGWPSRQVWQAGGQQGDFLGIPFGGGLWMQGDRWESVGRPCLQQTGRQRPDQ